MTATITRQYRGISKRAAVEYLVGMGGEAVSEAEVRGDGWRARLSDRTVSVGPTLKITEVAVEFAGESDRLDAVVDTFSQKAMRAGG